MTGIELQCSCLRKTATAPTAPRRYEIVETRRDAYLRHLATRARQDRLATPTINVEWSTEVLTLTINEMAHADRTGLIDGAGDPQSADSATKFRPPRLMIFTIP